MLELVFIRVPLSFETPFVLLCFVSLASQEELLGRKFLKGWLCFTLCQNITFRGDLIGNVSSNIPGNFIVNLQSIFARNLGFPDMNLCPCHQKIIIDFAKRETLMVNLRSSTYYAEYPRHCRMNLSLSPPRSLPFLVPVRRTNFPSFQTYFSDISPH